MGKGWRKKLLTQELPSQEELLPKFSNLIDQIVDIVVGRSSRSTFLHFWFYKTVSYKVLGKTKGWTPQTYMIIRERIGSISNISEEDIRQQVTLYLFEMWEFYRNKIKPGKKTRFVFYDYVRFNLIKHTASWISTQILTSTGDILAPVFSDVMYMEEPDDLDFSLSWVMLKSNQGVLSELTIRQKYLVFLRYIKSMKITEIANLTGRHRSLIEKDFSQINQILGIGGHYVNSRNVS